jgi:D-alanyl-lipoteichoic acid acyltransferase DltB (MBOAT superfamily)
MSRPFPAKGGAMNFNSWQFLVFFPVVWALSLIVATRFTRLLLLASSLFFYACWNPAYLVLILFSVTVTWVAGLFMEGRSQTRKKLILALSLILNLAILFFFKYYNFFATTVNALFAGIWPGTRGVFPALNVLLPAGISFYTFQALGYSIDVYRGTIKAERSFIVYALFVTFFPQLVAGPIERASTLLPQFKTNCQFDYDRVVTGLKRAAWGMFKKAVIADRLAIYVNSVYGNPGVYPAAALLLATFFFAFQIYCDFSGYSDIAIGTARILGFRLMTNFHDPYFSVSIGEFWRRWHISLSTWLKDYVYIPLGGSRKGRFHRDLNLIITFVLSGLWHGAAWHFVFWGLLHGLFQIIERNMGSFFKQIKQKHGGVSTGLAHVDAQNSRTTPVHRLAKVPRILAVFTLVCLAWVFFRAENLSDAVLILKKFTTLPAELAEHTRRLPETGLIPSVRDAFQLGNAVENPIANFGITACGLSFVFIAVLLAAPRWTKGRDGAALSGTLPVGIRWAAYYALILVILLGRPAESSQFIYFTF